MPTGNKQPNCEQSKHRNIVQMLKELRTTSYSDVSGCNPDSDISSDEKLTIDNLAYWYNKQNTLRMLEMVCKNLS